MKVKITIEYIKVSKDKPFIEYRQEYTLRYSLGRAFETILNYITRRGDYENG